MANIYSAQSGPASSPSTWFGGVVPVSGDRVLIKTGHVVTIDGTHTWGDDSTATIVIDGVSTTAGIFVNGTLRASRTVNSTLTCRGDLLIAAGGTLDYGTELDPIPANVTATLVPNFSSAMAHSKYMIGTSPTLLWSGFRMWGANKTPRTQLTAAAASGDTVFTVADATGWRVGDVLVFGLTPHDASVGGSRIRAITAISGNQITVGASLGNASQIGRTVLNLTRNVRVVAHQGNSFRACVSVRVPSTMASTDAIEIGPCEICCADNASVYGRMGGLTLMAESMVQTNMSVKRVYRPVCHDVLSVSGSTVTLLISAPAMSFFGNQAAPYTAEEVVVSSQNVVNFQAGTSTVLLNPHLVRADSLVMGYSQGPVGARVQGGHLEAITWAAVMGNASDVLFDGTNFNGLHQLSENFLSFPSLRLLGCNFGGNFGVYSVNKLSVNWGHYFAVTVENCTVHPSFTPTRASNLNRASPNSFINVRNKNNDITQQEIYRRGGLILRDNSMTRRGKSSVSLSPWYAGIPLSHTVSVPIGASATITVVAAMRFNATYGTATPPKIIVSGMGLTPQEYTCPATADTWHPVTITVTNPQTYPGTITLELRAESAANTQTATAWFDGLAMIDMVPWARHYGYKYDPINPVRVVDPVVQLTEAAASALTGISFSGGTLTISQPRTIREVYDWMQAYECANRLDPIMVSDDGQFFTLAANLTLNAPLTGAGTLDMPSNTLTVGSGGSSTVLIAHNAGRYVAITVAGALSGSRVQIFDLVANAELYNGVPSAFPLAVSVNWTADRALRVRVGRVIGASASMPVELLGTLTNTGANFTVSQVPNTVYNSIGIDGSTCTEFVPDYPNLQIDISDPDGTTSVQRLYAWSSWAETTAPGIAQMFRAVTAQDVLNFTIDTSVVNARLDNVHSTPVIVAGGYLTRSDGTTVIAPSSGSIHLDPGRAYLAPTAPAAIAAAVWAHPLP